MSGGVINDAEMENEGFKIKVKYMGWEEKN